MKPSNTITISFKQSEMCYLEEFRKRYAVPTAIIKDFIINTVKGVNYEVDNTNIIKSSKSEIELVDF